MPHGGEPRRNVRENRWGLLPRAQEDRASYSNQENAARRQFFAAMPHELKHRKQREKENSHFPSSQQSAGEQRKDEAFAEGENRGTAAKNCPKTPIFRQSTPLNGRRLQEQEGIAKKGFALRPEGTETPALHTAGFPQAASPQGPRRKEGGRAEIAFGAASFSKTHIAASSALAGCAAVETKSGGRAALPYSNRDATEPFS